MKVVREGEGRQGDVYLKKKGKIKPTTRQNRKMGENVEREDREEREVEKTEDEKNRGRERMGALNFFPLTKF